MSQENVEIVREMYEPFARGDFSAWADLPDDFEFVASPELPDAGTYRGEAAVRWMTTWVESFDGHTIEATEIIDAGDDKVLVAILQRGRPRGSQTVVEGRWWVVMTLRGDELPGPRCSRNAPRPSKPPGCGSRSASALREKQKCRFHAKAERPGEMDWQGAPRAAPWE